MSSTASRGTARTAHTSSIWSAWPCATSKRSCRKFFRASIRAFNTAPAAPAERSCRRRQVTALRAADALEWDAADALAGFAAQFHHPCDAAGRKLVYLCGHSLGLQPRSAADYVGQELTDWQHLAVLGHGAAKRPWIPYHERAAAPLAALTVRST